MANEVEILGSENLALGFGSNVIGEIYPETITEEPTADIEYIQDGKANDGVALISNRGRRFTGEGHLLASESGDDRRRPVPRRELPGAPDGQDDPDHDHGLQAGRDDLDGAVLRHV